MVRIPVPKNKLVLFTLVGAVLTGAVAVGLAYPDAVSGDETTTATTTPQDGANSVDAPAPNESFTPEVADTGYGEEYEEEEDEHEDHDEEGLEYDEEDDEHEEYEEESSEYDEDEEEGYDD